MGIPIILIRPATMQCPECGEILRRGEPRFGPARIKCGKCGQIINSGLTPWKEKSFLSKCAIAFSELIAPSRWGKSCFVILINCMLCAVFVFFRFDVYAHGCGRAGSA